MIIYASDTYKNEYTQLDTVNITFIFLYFLEAIIIIIAVGIYLGPSSYFHKWWNWLDIVIIIIGVIAIIPSIRENKGMRILNMIRFIKLTYTTESMKKLMKPWIKSIIKMTNVFLVLVFILAIYAVTGLGEFSGNRYFRCRMIPEPINGIWEPAESINRLCNAYGNGDYKCPKDRYCGTPEDYDLSITDQEKYGSELVFYGAVGFEDFFKAFLASFQVITFDDWAKIMYRIQDSDDLVLGQIIFPSLVFIGSFFCLNLIVAVIVDTFQSNRAAIAEKEKQIKEKELLMEMKVIQFNENSDSETQRVLKCKTPKAIEVGISHEIEGNKEKEDNNIDEYKNKNQELINNKSEDNDDENPKVIQIEEVKLDSSQVSDTNTPIKNEFNSNENFAYKIQNSILYKVAIVSLIIINLILLCLNRSKSGDTEILVLDILDGVIFLFFIIEMVMTVVNIGIVNYLKNKHIDLLTNLLGIVEIILTCTNYSNGIFYCHNRLHHTRYNNGLQNNENIKINREMACINSNYEFFESCIGRHILFLHSSSTLYIFICYYWTNNFCK